MIVSFLYLSINHKNGISTFSKNLSKIFKKDIKFVSIYKYGNKVDNEFCFNLPYIFLLKLLNLLSGYRLTSFLFDFYLNKNDADILIINAPSMIKCVRFNKKIIYVQHHSVSTLINNKANFNNNYKFINYFSNRIYKFVVLSEKDKLEAINKLNIKEEKIVVIPHMINTNIAQVHRKKNRKKILMLSRIDNAQKRFDLVINVMKNKKDWTLSIYGDGPDFEIIKSEIEKLKLDNVAIYHGVDDPLSIIEQHDVHVMVSDYEGFGITNIEAMSLGLPLIIRNTFPSASSLINSNGVLLSESWNENDFINALNYIDENYEVLSKGSLIHANNFSEDKISSLWKDIIK